MQRVAETVGITSMAIYHHFSSRDALLDTITDPEFAKLLSYMHRIRSHGGVEDRLLAIAGVRYRYGTWRAAQKPKDECSLIFLICWRYRHGARQVKTDVETMRASLRHPCRLAVCAFALCRSSG